MLPNFVIIGAMKGGTSSLYNYLASHPDVIASREKETDFFISKKRFTRGLEWYEQQFEGSGQFAFEASPNYAKRHKFKGVPRRMHSVLPEAKLIYVLRDPIERAISHYVHSLHKQRESQSFADAIREPDNNYVQTSRYYYQLRAFLKYYAREQILLVESEKLRDHTEETVAGICNFLGLSQDYDRSILQARFHQSSEKIVEADPESPDQAPQKISKPQLSNDDITTLTAQLGPDVAKLRKMSGLPFSGWSL